MTIEFDDLNETEHKCAIHSAVHLNNVEISEYTQQLYRKIQITVNKEVKRQILLAEIRSHVLIGHIGITARKSLTCMKLTKKLG